MRLFSSLRSYFPNWLLLALLLAGPSAAFSGPGPGVGAVSNGSVSGANALEGSVFSRLGLCDFELSGHLGAYTVHNCGGAFNVTNELGVSAKTARRHLRNSIGGSQGGQIHHIIPWEMRSHPLVKSAANAGFNINGAENAVRLFKHQHFGSHPRFNRAIEGMLDRLHASRALGTNNEAAELLLGYIKRIEPNLSTISTRLR